MDRPPYSARPDNAELTLSLDEIESLAGERGKPLKDGRVAAHFTHRVLLTVREYISAVQRLTYELESVQARSRSRAGVATTLNPMDAAQYLTAEQRTELFNSMMRATLDKANQSRLEAETETQQARKLHGRMRLALSRILDDQHLDLNVRERLRSELDRIDNEPVTDTNPSPTTTTTFPTAPSVSAAALNGAGDTLADIFGEQ